MSRARKRSGGSFSRRLDELHEAARAEAHVPRFRSSDRRTPGPHRHPHSDSCWKPPCSSPPFLPAGTTPCRRSFCAMGRSVTRTRVVSVWQKLASAIAILAVAMFVAHGAAAKGPLPHDHSVAHAETSLIAGHTAAEPEGAHEHSSAVSHKYGTTTNGTAACCGEACLLALMPDIDTQLSKPWGVRSRALLRVSSLSGHDPDGLRRPPRLLHRS